MSTPATGTIDHADLEAPLDLSAFLRSLSLHAEVRPLDTFAYGNVRMAAQYFSGLAYEYERDGRLEAACSVWTVHCAADIAADYVRRYGNDDGRVETEALRAAYVALVDRLRFATTGSVGDLATPVLHLAETLYTRRVLEDRR